MDNVINNFWLNGGASRGIEFRKEQQQNGNVLTDKILNYTIDSCDTFDEGYETAIWKNNNNMIIVERYSTIKEMEIGHKKWCEFCKTNPTEVYSVQTDEIEKF